jgi:hypothetical protein
MSPSQQLQKAFLMQQEMCFPYCVLPELSLFIFCSKLLYYTFCSVFSILLLLVLQFLVHLSLFLEASQQNLFFMG